MLCWLTRSCKLETLELGAASPLDQRDNLGVDRDVTPTALNHVTCKPKFALLS